MDIEDYKKISVIREKILDLFHTSNINENLIESMLKPVEGILGPDNSDDDN
jgi:hypothetical protein